MRQLSAAERGVLIGKLSAGVRIKRIERIAREMGVTPSTVRYWRRRFDETGNVERQIGSGRPECTTRQQD